MEYLLRFDGAKENDEFFDTARQRPDVVYYAGSEMRVGTWIPDGIRVRLSEPSGELATIDIVLIELEPTDVQARISARKYLPESSNVIVASRLAVANHLPSRDDRRRVPRGVDHAT